jgi:hypothetical protein
MKSIEIGFGAFAGEMLIFLWWVIQGRLYTRLRLKMTEPLLLASLQMFLRPLRLGLERLLVKC